MCITWAAYWRSNSISSDMEPCVNTESFSRLAEVYRCVQTASKPRGSPADVARWMFPQVRGSGSAEMTRIGLTVVGKIASSVTAQSSLAPEVASYFTELLKVLLDDMSLMSHLVSAPRSESSTARHGCHITQYPCPPSTRCPSSRMRIRFSHIWLPRVHQRVFFTFFSSL